MLNKIEIITLWYQIYWENVWHASIDNNLTDYKYMYMLEWEKKKITNICKIGTIIEEFFFG